ncbi:folate family ECF transporter S component [Secundilactobacillus yichangensis]|uniref:folate family ECF transporter S component n=1 Tax=Secundilactobacillus yichangensis TaxID=2799580 RepID=UPI001F164A19|nr:folate family ECF transporter S component [Secundilactobacillus yichangensis]
MKEVRLSSAYIVAAMSVLIAMQVVLGSFFSIQFLITKITFSFIVTAIMARLFPPKLTAAATALAYLIGMLLFPKFSFFVGFIITAALTGYTFGELFYQKPVKLWRIALASLIVTMGWNLLLNSLWLHIMYGMTWNVLFTTRVPQELISFVIYTVLISVVFKVFPIDRFMRR